MIWGNRNALIRITIIAAVVVFAAPMVSAQESGKAEAQQTGPQQTGSKPAEQQQGMSDRAAEIIKNFRVGIVNTVLVRRKSLALNAVNKQLEEKRRLFREVIQAREQALRQEDQQLLRQRNILEANVFRTQRRQFEEKIAIAQKEIQAQTEQLNAAGQSARIAFDRVMNEVIQEVAIERNLLLVLDQQQVILSVTNLNLTDVIIVRINERLPQLKIPLLESE